MTKKKIVILSSSDDSDTDTEDKALPPPSSFISGNINKNLDKRITNVICSNKPKAEPKKKRTVFKKEEKPSTSVQASSLVPPPERIDPVRVSECSSSVSSESVIELSDEEPTHSRRTRASKRNCEAKKTSPNKAIQIQIEEDDDEIQLLPTPANKTSSKENKLDTSVDVTSDEYIKQMQEKDATAPIDIKMKRLDRIEYFTSKRNEPISSILDNVAQKFGIPVSSIILYLNDELVDIKATPNSLNLTVADIFDVLARSCSQSSLQPTETDSTANDPNFITLHLRDNTKKRLTLRINRLKTVRDLAEHYAKEKGVNLANLKLEFDSDVMSLDKKIDYYDMEDDDQIDVIVKS